MLKINDKITIPEKYIRIVFVRSGGPGGQNVNKVNTQAKLVFDLDKCSLIDQYVRQKLIQLAGARYTNRGTIIISSEKHRSQFQNRNDCLERLRRMVIEASIPEKIRKKTRPTRTSKLKRLQNKKYRSQVKKMRKRVGPDD